MIEREYQAKRENARILRRQRANIPEMLEIDTFPFDQQPKLDRRRVMSLYDSFDYMTKQRSVIWLGPTGCGKTGLATSFLLQAIDRGYRGYFITFPELLQELFQSLADRSDRKLLKRYVSYDCLVIDEVGYVEVEPAQVGQFFTLMHKRHKRKTTIITSKACVAASTKDLRRSDGIRMARDDFRRKADAVREIPLEVVLAALGAQRDRRDRSQWRTEQGPITVTGPRFFNWHVEQGGGGAIDLAMHLRGCDAGEAIAWLTSHLGHHAPADQTTIRPRLSPTADASPSSPCVPRGPLRLPAANPSHLPRLKRYLIQQRALRLDLVDSLVDAGRLYADGRGNAVFVMVAGKPPRAIGAELRGTGTRVWRGLAPGTRRDAGYFWIGTQPAQKIVLCESAIDAISCFQLHGAPEREPHAHAHAHAQLHGPCICISTAGVRSDAPWLKPLLDRGYPLYCGFDNDDAGHAAASRMISRYPSIRRLIPPAHDWNDVLKANP